MEDPRLDRLWGPLAAAFVGAAVAFVGTACGAGEPDPGPDPMPEPDLAGPLFAPNHVVDVRITIDLADWDELRNQTRSLTDIFGDMCLAEPYGSPFTFFHGTVEVDGETVADAGVRKKGFLGSLDDEKPSLKIKFDEYVAGTELFGLDRLTLNNAKSDASYVNQCVAFSVFAAAGVPAPRCNFAHVWVNGADMGVYANVESVDKEFLRRFFDDDEGNLYEGTLSDFRPGWTGTFEKKTNELDPDRSDLERVVAALEGNESGLLDRLAAVMDLDAFFTFWAVEVLITHADGYAGNTNNFFVYDDPSTGRFTFMPWGVDYVMRGNPFVGEQPVPVSVFATGVLAWRLYANPTARAMYVDRLREVLDAAWNENAILAELDRMEGLIGPLVDPDGTVGLAAEIDVVRDFVTTRRGILLAEINSTSPDWPLGLRDEPCFEILGDVAGTFDTMFDADGNADPFASGTATIGGTLEANAMFQLVSSIAGWDTTDPANPSVQLAMLGLRGDGTVDIVVFAMPPELFLAGTTLPVDFSDVFGGVWNLDPATGASTVIGWIVEGSLTLGEAATVEGAPVSGSFQGEVALLGL